ARGDDAWERTEFDPLIRASRQVLSGLKLDGVPTAAEVRDFAATLNAFGLGVVDIKRASTC
ncbi:MAG: hypothetical protein LDL55_02475, partial [Armatimonadetes bacterium]|nr:hypothetical protein [Armatimonadota bacterium]